MSTSNVTSINRHPSRSAADLYETVEQQHLEAMRELVEEFRPDNVGLDGTGYDWTIDRFVVVEVNRNGNVYFDFVDSVADYDPDLFDGGWTPTMIIDLSRGRGMKFKDSKPVRYEVDVQFSVKLGYRISQS